MPTLSPLPLISESATTATHSRNRPTSSKITGEQPPPLTPLHKRLPYGNELQLNPPQTSAPADPNAMFAGPAPNGIAEHSPVAEPTSDSETVPTFFQHRRLPHSECPQTYSDTITHDVATVDGNVSAPVSYQFAIESNFTIHQDLSSGDIIMQLKDGSNVQISRHVVGLLTAANETDKIMLLTPDGQQTPIEVTPAEILSAIQTNDDHGRIVIENGHQQQPHITPIGTPQHPSQDVMSAESGHVATSLKRSSSSHTPRLATCTTANNGSMDGLVTANSIIFSSIPFVHTEVVTTTSGQQLGQQQMYGDTTVVRHGDVSEQEISYVSVPSYVTFTTIDEQQQQEQQQQLQLLPSQPELRAGFDLMHDSAQHNDQNIHQIQQQDQQQQQQQPEQQYEVANNGGGGGDCVANGVAAGDLEALHFSPQQEEDLYVFDDIYDPTGEVVINDNSLDDVLQDALFGMV